MSTDLVPALSTPTAIDAYVRRCDQTGDFQKFSVLGDLPSRTWIKAEVSPAGGGLWHVAVVEFGGKVAFTKRPLPCDQIHPYLENFGVGSVEWGAEPALPATDNPWNSGLVPKLARQRDVYFIQGVDGGRIKIGMAYWPEGRLEKLQSMSPIRLRIIGLMPGGGAALERRLHDRFSATRAYGEWFEPTDELLAYIREHSIDPGTIHGEAA